MKFHESIHGVYFDDLDAFQVLHNARYLLLFERSIGAFWQRLGWGKTLDATLNPDQYQVVRANKFEYDRPVRGVGEVRVRVWIEKLGRTSLTFGGWILPMDHDTPYARGERTVIRVDPVTFSPTPWTDEFRAAVGPYVRVG